MTRLTETDVTTLTRDLEAFEARLLEAAPDAGPGRLIALAVYFGNTRLIDNLIIPAEG